MHSFESRLPTLTWELIYSLAIVGCVKTASHPFEEPLPGGIISLSYLTKMTGCPDQNFSQAGIFAIDE